MRYQLLISRRKPKPWKHRRSCNWQLSLSRHLRHPLIEKPLISLSLHHKGFQFQSLSQERKESEENCCEAKSWLASSLALQLFSLLLSLSTFSHFSSVPFGRENWEGLTQLLLWVSVRAFHFAFYFYYYYDKVLRVDWDTKNQLAWTARWTVRTFPWMSRAMSTCRRLK